MHAASLLTLTDASAAQVVAVHGGALLRERLVELGFCAGIEVVVLRRAPFGGPLQVRVRGGSIALRADEAECVHVVQTVAAGAAA